MTPSLLVGENSLALNLGGVCGFRIVGVIVAPSAHLTNCAHTLLRTGKSKGGGGYPTCRADSAISAIVDSLRQLRGSEVW